MRVMIEIKINYFDLGSPFAIVIVTQNMIKCNSIRDRSLYTLVDSIQITRDLCVLLWYLRPISEPHNVSKHILRFSHLLDHISKNMRSLGYIKFHSFISQSQINFHSSRRQWSFNLFEPIIFPARCITITNIYYTYIRCSRFSYTFLSAVATAATHNQMHT